MIFESWFDSIKDFNVMFSLYFLGKKITPILLPKEKKVAFILFLLNNFFYFGFLIYFFTNNFLPAIITVVLIGVKYNAN